MMGTGEPSDRGAVNGKVHEHSRAMHGRVMERNGRWENAVAIVKVFRFSAGARGLMGMGTRA
jgi:hypothetical protein